MNIEIFEIKDNINIPIYGDSPNYANSSIGSHIIIICNDVYVKNWCDENPNEYLLSELSSSFIKNNNH